MAGGGGPRGSGNQNARVYVGNLAWDVAWQDLKDHMRGLGGDVIRADVMTDQGGRSRGCGIVEFADPEQAGQAIEQLNNSELKGRMIFVREVCRELGVPGCYGVLTVVYDLSLIPSPSFSPSPPWSSFSCTKQIVCLRRSVFGSGMNARMIESCDGCFPGVSESSGGCATVSC